MGSFNIVSAQIKSNGLWKQDEVFSLRIWLYFCIPKNSCKFSHTNSQNFATTLSSHDDHLTARAWAACGVNLSSRNNAISTELSNVNWEKHKCKSHRVCRRDNKPRRIPIQSLNSLRNKLKSRKIREFVHAIILSCILMSSTLYC